MTSTSNAEVTRTLETLKDLDGIFGSFLVAENGVIVAQDLPSYFGSAAYDVGPRALRFQEALSMTQGDVAYCILRFGGHKLALRKIQGALLTIVGSSEINMPALRMAMNLVARKLSSQDFEVTTRSSPPPPTIRPPSESEVESEKRSRRQPSMGAPESAGAHRQKKRALYFRGKRVQ